MMHDLLLLFLTIAKNEIQVEEVILPVVGYLCKFCSFPPLAPPTQQPPTMSGTSAPGLPVDTCGSSGAVGKKQNSGWCLRHLGPAQGRRTGHCTAYPPPVPWWPRPIPHQPSGERSCLPRRCDHHPPSHAFWPFDGPSHEQLRTQWTALHGIAGTLWPPECHGVSPDSIGAIAAAQHSFSRQAAQSILTPCGSPWMLA
jgi:hypothetical protein